MPVNMVFWRFGVIYSIVSVLTLDVIYWQLWSVGSRLVHRAIRVPLRPPFGDAHLTPAFASSRGPGGQSSTQHSITASNQPNVKLITRNCRQSLKKIRITDTARKEPFDDFNKICLLSREGFFYGNVLATRKMNIIIAISVCRSYSV